MDPNPDHMPLKERNKSEPCDVIPDRECVILTTECSHFALSISQPEWMVARTGGDGLMDGWRDAGAGVPECTALHLLPSSAVICCPTAGQRLLAFCSLVIRLTVWLPALGSPVTQFDMNQH